MPKFNNILLFGGETKNENMPVGFYSSIALLQLYGKPILWWQLDNLKKNGIDNVILVANKNNEKLINYINNICKKSFDITLVKVSSRKCILSSLKYGLLKANQNLPTRIILGDTFIPKSIKDEVDMLYTSKNLVSSNNWCLIDKKGEYINNFYDKQNVSISDKEVLVGYYSVSDTKFLLDCCIKLRLLCKKELSDVLNVYKNKHNLKAKQIDDWYDFGHTSGLIKAKSVLFGAREFNSISVDTETGILTKTSKKKEKLKDEAFWFKNLPEELKIFTPRLIDFVEKENIASVSQELYGYPSLQELYLSQVVNIEDWSYILEKLFNLHKNFEKYRIKNESNLLKWLYIEKTQERIDETISQNEYWKTHFNKKYEVINGKKHLGIKKLKNKIEEYSQTLIKNKELTIMHGDYCFSNILFDSNNYIFKLIDPRGGINNQRTIYGDSRYDIAKLRHSVCGLYDFMVNGLFQLKETQDEYNYLIHINSEYLQLQSIFDNLCKEHKFDIKEIKFIEGLLFLTMIPLHKDDFERQKMFYIRALELLNEILI